MANRDCNGDFFRVDGIEYYRCLWDGSVVTGAHEGGDCPECKRLIFATNHGDIPSSPMKMAMLPNRIKVLIPATSDT